jgi:hypothetical protein
MLNGCWRDEMSDRMFEHRLSCAWRQIIDISLSDVLVNIESRNLAKRFRDYGKAYFRFITTPGIEPTNNVVERAIRFVVIDRVVTQGRGETGRL